MKEKEPKPSLLTWESAAIVLASVGAGFVLGSRETRLRIGRELWLYYQGFKNVTRRRQDKKMAAELESKVREMLARAFPRGLEAEK